MLKTCLAVILGLTLIASAHAQVYQWRDAKGKVHFGDQPPPGVAAKLMRPGGHGAPAAAPVPAQTPEAAPEPEIDPPLPDAAGELPAETDTADLDPLDADVAPEEPALLVPAPAVAAPTPPPAQPQPTTQQRIEAELKASQEERAKAREAQAQAERERKQAAALEEDCARARNQLTALEGGQRFARINERGEREVLDEKARAAEIARMREMLGTSCK